MRISPSGEAIGGAWLGEPEDAALDFARRGHGLFDQDFGVAGEGGGEGLAGLLAAVDAADADAGAAA